MENKKNSKNKPKQLKFKFKGLPKNKLPVNLVDYELESRRLEYLLRIDKYVIL